jgi:hypothetical protein
MIGAIWKPVLAFLVFILLERAQGICFNETNTNVVSYLNTVLRFWT